MTMITPAFRQQAFRGRDDDVATNSATFTHALNTGWTQAANSVFRIRFVIEETAGGSENVTWAVYASVNGGAYTECTTSTPVQVFNSTNITDDEATTSVLGGTGAFLAGYASDVDARMPNAGNQSWSGNQYTELEQCLRIDADQVDDGDTITLQVRKSTGTTITYNQTPSITASVLTTITGTMAAAEAGSDTFVATGQGAVPKVPELLDESGEILLDESGNPLWDDSYEPAGNDVSPNSVSSASFVGTPTLGQTHVLTPAEVATASFVGTPTLGQTHALIVDGVTAAAHTGVPTIGQTHVLSVSGIASASFVGNPTVGQVFALAPEGVASASFVGTPSPGQTHVLELTGVSAASFIGTTTLGQEHNLTPTGVVSASFVGNPTVGLASGNSVEPLDAISASFVGVTTLGQMHLLEPNGVASASVLGVPELGSTHLLEPSSLVSGAHVGSPAIGQTHVLAVDELVSASFVGQPGLGQTHIVQPASVVSAGFTGSPALNLQVGQSGLNKFGLRIDIGI